MTYMYPGFPDCIWLCVVVEKKREEGIKNISIVYKKHKGNGALTEMALGPQKV